MTPALKLAVSEKGQGPTLVLLHGFPLNRGIWKQQQDALAGQARVICPDLRGHGESPVPPGPYSMETMAQDVLNLLDDLKVDRAVLMGHSMGGYVTLAAYQMAPQRFSGLGLICSQAAADTEQARAGRKQLIDKVGKEGAKAAAEAMLPKLLPPGQDLQDPLAQQIRQLILQTRPESIQSSLQGLADRPDRTDFLATIKVPLLILAGKDDQIIPAAKAEAMAQAAPKARLVLLDKTGHMPMLENPEATTAAIRDFISQ